MKHKVRILSDLHFGHRCCKVEEVAQLRPLLEDCDEVIFNGDTFEGRGCAYSERGERMRDELIALCHEIQIQARFLTGNHDPDASEEKWTTLADGVIAVTHGDVFFPKASPWNRDILMRELQVTRMIQEKLGCYDSLEVRLGIANRVAKEVETAHIGRRLPRLLGLVKDLFYPPARPIHLAHVWWNFPQQAADFLKKYSPHSKVAICGHFHRPGVWQRDGRFVINTGAFMPKSPMNCVDFEGEWLTVYRIKKTAAGFEPAAVLGKWRLQASYTIERNGLDKWSE